MNIYRDHTEEILYLVGLLYTKKALKVEQSRTPVSLFANQSG
jgi:hypothetical protein